MNEENIYGTTGASAPVLDDIDYSAPAEKKSGPQGVAAPVLDDMDYVAPTAKKGGPEGVAAPVLDSMDTYTPDYGEKKGAPTDVTAPVLDDDTYNAAPKKNVLSDEEIIAGLSSEQKAMYDTLPSEKQKQIIDMRRAQLGAEAPVAAVTAPVLDEDNYTPPPKKEEKKPEAPISAPVLDEEPEAPKYVPKFVDEDLEKAKQEAKKKAVSSQLVSNQKDEKESLRMMLELKAEREAEAAKKGFKIVLALVFVGIIAAVAFFLLYSGKLGLAYKDGMSGISSIIEGSALYIAVAAAVIPLTLLTGMGGMKSLTSFVYFVFGVIQLFPGIGMLPQHEGSMVIAGVLYAVSLICTLVVFITLSASECVGLFFKKQKQQFDH